METERPAIGDPGGVRPSRERYAALSEAGHIARALRAILVATGTGVDECGSLITRIATAEQAALLRKGGRVEPRRRFKHRSGTPLHERRPRELLFADECGRSERYVGGGSPNFALAGISVTPEAAEDYIRQADDLKRHFFGDHRITLHEPDMRNRERRFYFAGDSDRQTEFDAAVTELVAGTEFAAFGVAVRKDAFQAEFSDAGLDPYLPTDSYAVAIQILLERYLDYLAHKADTPMASVTLESIGPKEDALHQRDYVDTLLHGTQWVADSSFRNFLETGVRFARKDGSSPIELADMLARDLFEWVRAGCVGQPGRWGLFSARIHCRGDGSRGKFGIKVFPDSDIRAAIEAHRDESAPEN